MELLQIRKVRAAMMAAISIGSADLKELRRLAAWDRYDRMAQSKRRQAARRLCYLELRLTKGRMD